MRRDVTTRTTPFQGERSDGGGDGATGEAPGGGVTAGVRQARAAIRRRLARLAVEIGSLEDAASDGSERARMERLARELDASLRPHLRWEEATVHPIADKYACEGPAVFSASMRYEHEIIYRWLAELEALAAGDAAGFRRRADNLLGVVLAHFELEENVLFPVLERSLGPAGLDAVAPAPDVP